MNTHTYMRAVARAKSPMLPGVWLLYDHDEDNEARVFSMWGYTEGSDKDTLMIAWDGVLMTPHHANHYTQSTPHADGWSKRFEMRRLSPAEVAALDMAAIHGVFLRQAARVWATPV